MLFGQAMKILITGLMAFLSLGLILFTARHFFPAGDMSFEIVNGYRFSDAGGYEKSIDYSGSERNPGTIIDARVDSYKLEGKRIMVARRPRVTKLGEDDALHSSLQSNCEYWIVDAESHTSTQVEKINGMQCQ